MTLGSSFEVDSFIDTMLQSRKNWKAVKAFVGKVLRTKEEEERQAQRESILDLIVD